MSFASLTRELRRDVLIMRETHIVMSSLIFRLALTLVFRLAHLLMLCLISLMDLTITHMILVHKRTTLCLDALVTVHVHILVIISRVDMVFLLESHTRFEPRHLDGPRFPHRRSRPTSSKGEVQNTVKTSSGRMVKY
jgi:hypothetical protein